MNSSTRIILAFAISLVAGVFLSLFNGIDLLLSLHSGFTFAIFTGIIVAFLSWGIDIAINKGYPSWAGFTLVLILNILGLVILMLLPKRTVMNSK